MLGNFINPETPYKGLLIFHGTGTGKCVTGNTYVYVNGEIETMREIWEKYKGEIRKQINEGEWSVPITNLQVNSLDNGIIKYDKIEKLYRQKINEEIKIIKLSNGLKNKYLHYHINY